MNETYHHGDLRRTLIETGIQFISREGEYNFSLRRIAAECGVSNAAPYAHFKNKEELLSAMKDHVTQTFMNRLEEAIQTVPFDRELLLHMGVAYVTFFVQNPHYYSFLFSRPDIAVDLHPDADPEENYPPFALFQKTVRQCLADTGKSAEEINNATIAMWALVHGLASIATMKNVSFYNWEEKIESIIRSLPKKKEDSYE